MDVPEIVKKQAVLLYEAGGNAQEVGKRFGYGSATVMQWVEEAAHRDQRPKSIFKPPAPRMPPPAQPRVVRPSAYVDPPPKDEAFDRALMRHTAALRREYAVLGLGELKLP